jgi:hypothetical protein
MIYVNGDSYSERSSLGGAWSDYLGQESHNNAKAGSSNDRIIRTTIEDILQLGPGNIEKVIIGFSFFMREEVWWDNELVTLDQLRDKREARDLTVDKMIDLNINHQTVHHYTYIWMLANTLENLGLDYLFFSAADNEDYKMLDWDSLKSLQIYKDINENKRIINLHSFNIKYFGQDNNCNLTPTYHFADLDGHKKFGEFLVENYLS